MFNFENMSDKELLILWISLNYNELLISNVPEVLGLEVEFLKHNNGFAMWCELEDEINRRNSYAKTLREV